MICMKILIRFGSALLPAILFLAAQDRLPAQSFTILHRFAPTDAATNGVPSNADGVSPIGGLVLSGNTLYGTTISGGPSGLGTVFKMKIDGTGFTSLYNFTTNDVWNPSSGVILSGTNLYGTGAGGGDYNWGGVFAINTDGTGFRNLYSFTGTEGAYPYSRLVLTNNTLYGTTTGGGDFGLGTIFRVNTDGTDFTTLYSFSGSPSGAGPWTGLVLSGNTLYGTSRGGGGFDEGTVFGVNIDGTGYRQLHSFTGGADEGGDPSATLLLANNVLYGTVAGGFGPNGIVVLVGSVFKVNTDGAGFRTLHVFSGGSNGMSPIADLIVSGNVLYGTTYEGGAFDAGFIFAINTDGTGFTNLYNFTRGDDGAYPSSGLILAGNALYGTASQGGNSGNGTIFRLSLGAAPAPQLSMIPSGTSFQMLWPTNANGFTLQSATDLSTTTVWTAVSTAPVVIDGQNTVTIPCDRTQQYFRLAR